MNAAAKKNPNQTHGAELVAGFSASLTDLVE